jgi:hypothetical protein
MDAVQMSFLAAGGVIGSGWLLSGTDVDETAANWWALGFWLIGAVRSCSRASRRRPWRRSHSP